MNCFSLELLPKHQEPSYCSKFGEVRIWFIIFSGKTIERVKVENLENQRMKIVDESILFFFRVSLSKFSLEEIGRASCRERVCYAV